MARTYLVFAAVLAAIAYCEAKAAEGSTYPIVPQSLINLGGVNGKFFFYENSTTGNWNAAKKTCSDAGLILAEVQTDEEVAFLNTQAAASQFSGWYWVGARDTRNYNQFVWDHTGENFSSGLPLRFNIEPLTCVFLYITNVTSAVFMAAPCASEDIISTLCQTV